MSGFLLVGSSAGLNVILFYMFLKNMLNVKSNSLFKEVVTISLDSINTMIKLTIIEKLKYKIKFCFNTDETTF